MSSPERHRHVSAIRRLLRLRPHPDQNPLLNNTSSSSAKKPNMLLRGLGCTSSAAAHVPSDLSTRADWGEGKRNKKRRKKKKEKKGAASAGGGGATSADVWCVEASVDCVVERAHRERHCIARRVTMQEQIDTYMESNNSPDLDAHFLANEMMPPGRFMRRNRGYHHSPPVLQDEMMMMYSTRMLFGGMSFYDRHRDLRLDVDNMSYEELLELGDKIGHVSTGLREDEILCKISPCTFNPSIYLSSSEIERKCSICQEEYEENEEMGKLECGHLYHLYCIKQWLSHKNSCPLCKTSVSKKGN